MVSQYPAMNTAVPPPQDFKRKVHPDSIVRTLILSK